MPLIGRFDLGVIQVEAGGGFVGLGGGQRGFGFADGFAAAVVFLVGNRLGALQTLGALEVVLHQFEMGLGLLASGLGLLQLGLVGARINHEQQVAGLHLRPVLEVDGVNVAGDARPDFDHLDRLQVAGVFVPVGDRGELRLFDRDLGGRESDGFGRRAGRQHGGAEEREQTVLKRLDS